MSRVQRKDHVACRGVEIWSTKPTQTHTATPNDPLMGEERLDWAGYNDSQDRLQLQVREKKHDQHCATRIHSTCVTWRSYVAWDAKPRDSLTRKTRLFSAPVCTNYIDREVLSGSYINIHQVKYSTHTYKKAISLIKRIPHVLSYAPVRWFFRQQDTLEKQRQQQPYKTVHTICKTTMLVWCLIFRYILRCRHWAILPNEWRRYFKDMKCASLLLV